MACNCNEGKTYNIGMGCCVPTLAPIENYYTKYQVDRLIESATTSGVTTEEVDNKITSAMTEIEAEIPTVPTEVSAFNNDAGYLTQHQSLSGYVTDAELSAYTYDKATIDEKVAGGGTFDPTNYYNKTEVNNIVNSAKTEAEAAIPTSNSAFTNDAGYLTEHQTLKTINNQSLVGEGNITIEGGSGSGITRVEGYNAIVVGEDENKMKLRYFNADGTSGTTVLLQTGTVYGLRIFTNNKIGIDETLVATKGWVLEQLEELDRRITALENS